MRLPSAPRVLLYSRRIIQSRVCLRLIEDSRMFDTSNQCLTPQIVSERNILIPSSTVWCQLHRTNGFVQIPLTLLCQPHRPDGFVKIPLSPSHRIQVMYPKVTETRLKYTESAHRSEGAPTKNTKQHAHGDRP